MVDQIPGPDDFRRIQEILRPRIGKHRAITIEQIAIELGYVRGTTPAGGRIANRRPVEKVLETRLGDFEFMVVSSSACGIWRPAGPEDLNECLGEVRRRHRSLAIRDETWVSQGRRQGWHYDGSRFSVRPSQPELGLN